MRSRVTANDWPTSSKVCSLPSSRPKRILMTFSSRGVNVRRTCPVWSLRFTLFTDRRFKRDWLLRDLEHLADFRHRNIHALGDFFRSRLASQFLHELPRGADQL